MSSTSSSSSSGFSLPPFLRGDIDGVKALCYSPTWYKSFLTAQAKIVGICIVSYIGDTWYNSYPRNDNANPFMFWLCMSICVGVGWWTVKEKPAPSNGKPPYYNHYSPAPSNGKPARISLLSREQTEEWKGINIELYYVVPLHTAGFLMTYCTCWLQQWLEKEVFDYKGEGGSALDGENDGQRLMMPMSMELPGSTSSTAMSSSDSHNSYTGQINPITYYGSKLGRYIRSSPIATFLDNILRVKLHIADSYWQSRVTGVFISLYLHILFFDILKLYWVVFFWSDELAWRFAADKYTAIQGLICGMAVKWVTECIQWIENQENSNNPGESEVGTSDAISQSNSNTVNANSNSTNSNSNTQEDLTDSNSNTPLTLAGALGLTVDADSNGCCDSSPSSNIVSKFESCVRSIVEKIGHMSNPETAQLINGKLDQFTNYVANNRKRSLQQGLRIFGAILIGFWYLVWGYDSNKLQYNSRHPYILVLPLLGYLMIRNSSLYLTQRYSVFLEFLGRNTLETYVLQFHLFMCREVQHILVLIPGAHLNDYTSYGSFLNSILKVVNMAIVGCFYFFAAVEARKATVVTQERAIDVAKIWVGSDPVPKYPITNTGPVSTSITTNGNAAIASEDSVNSLSDLNSTMAIVKDSSSILGGESESNSLKKDLDNHHHHHLNLAETIGSVTVTGSNKFPDNSDSIVIDASATSTTTGTPESSLTEGVGSK